MAIEFNSLTMYGAAAAIMLLSLVLFVKGYKRKKKDEREKMQRDQNNNWALFLT